MHLYMLCKPCDLEKSRLLGYLHTLFALIIAVQLNPSDPLVVAAIISPGFDMRR